MKSIIVVLALALFSAFAFGQSESPTISKIRISRLSPFTQCVASEIQTQTGIYSINFSDLISLTGFTKTSRIQMVFYGHVTPTSPGEIMTLNLISQDPEGWHFSRASTGDDLTASSKIVSSFGVLSSNNPAYDNIMITLVNCQ